MKFFRIFYKVIEVGTIETKYKVIEAETIESAWFKLSLSVNASDTFAQFVHYEEVISLQSFDVKIIVTVFKTGTTKEIPMCISAPDANTAIARATMRFAHDFVNYGFNSEPLIEKVSCTEDKEIDD